MDLATVKSIETALNLVDTKKENLRKAFEELQSRSSMLSSFNLTWTDLNSHFTSLQSQLLHKFSTLQSLESPQTQKPKPGKRKPKFSPEPVPARPELKSLCENMDGLGLRNYVMERPKERTAIRVELGDAFKHAPEPGSMVLNAMEGFWDGNQGSIRLKAACVVLLEELGRSGVEIGAEVRERAMAVAVEWKGKMEAVHSGNGGDGDEEVKDEGGLERLGYLHLLAAYKLLNDVEYYVNVLSDYVVLGGRYRQTVDLCRMLGLESRVSDVVQRLISKDKQILAVKFIFEFELTDAFPPVPLLKAYVMDSKRVAQKIRRSGKNSRQSLNDAAVKEISALKLAIKCIDDHGLESQYPKDELVTRIEILEKEKAERKRPATAPVAKPQQQGKQQKQNGNKRMKPAGGPSAFKRKPPPNSVVRPSQASSLQRTGLLSDHAAPYLSSHAGAYSMNGSLVAAAPYPGPPTVYGLSGAPMGFSGNLNPSTSHPYPSETHAQVQPVYYDRAVGYGGYDVSSHYHHAYYPQ